MSFLSWKKLTTMNDYKIGSVTVKFFNIKETVKVISDWNDYNAHIEKQLCNGQLDEANMVIQAIKHSL